MGPLLCFWNCLIAASWRVPLPFWPRLLKVQLLHYVFRADHFWSSRTIHANGFRNLLRSSRSGHLAQPPPHLDATHLALCPHGYPRHIAVPRNDSRSVCLVMPETCDSAFLQPSKSAYSSTISNPRYHRNPGPFDLTSLQPSLCQWDTNYKTENNKRQRRSMLLSFAPAFGATQDLKSPSWTWHKDGTPLQPPWFFLSPLPHQSLCSKIRVLCSGVSLNVHVLFWETFARVLPSVYHISWFKILFPAFSPSAHSELKTEYILKKIKCNMWTIQ